MTKNELIDVLKQEGDAEKRHEEADKALLEYINDPEITLAFYSMTRWYSWLA